MSRYRNTSWFSCLSILLLAVFVQAQVSGCCKLGSWFRGIIPVAGAAQASVTGSLPATDESATPMASPSEHACCPKKAEAVNEAGQTVPSVPTASTSSASSTAASHACASSDHGCCLQGAGLNASGLVSIPSGPSFDAALPLLVHILGKLPAPEALSRSAFVRMDSGPPETRANLPLLI